MVRVVGCVLLFASLFFTAHILLEQQVQCTKVLERNDEHGIYYANFISDLYHYLNVSKIGSGLVTELQDCALACLKVVTCFSFNLAASPDIEGKLWCEHLPSDKYNSSDKFQANAFFHHYSIYVSSFSIYFIVRFAYCFHLQYKSYTLFADLIIQVLLTMTF